MSAGDLKVPRTQPACLVPFAPLSQTLTPTRKLQSRESGREDTLTHLMPASQQEINLITRTSSASRGELLEMMGGKRILFYGLRKGNRCNKSDVLPAARSLSLSV